MESLDAYRAELHAQTRVRASADANFTHSAFAELCGQLLEEAEELSNFEPCYFRAKGSRKRNLAVDGYAFDDADKSLRMLIANYSGSSAAETLTRTDAKAMFASLVAFIEDAAAGVVEQLTEESSPEHGLARAIRERADDISRYRCFLATDDVLSERVKDWPEGAIGGVPVEFHIWDAGRFLRAQQSRSGRDDLVVDFTEVVPGGLPCLPASVGAETYEGYLCVVPGRALADIYERYGSRLLEGNVRAFLSTSVAVNKGIQQTLQNQPHMFFAYNNGIAATASRVELRQTADGIRICDAEDFQIVNGGQTTASLAHARRKYSNDLNGVYVQMKLSVLSEENASTVVPLISRYSNSQNKVSEADFFSNHDYHRLLEKISRRLRAPAKGGSQVETFWFYERARGQFTVELSRLGARDRGRFELEAPRDQIITKTDLAKIENSWRMLPHEVSKGAQKNFVRFAEFITKAWDADQTCFHDEYFRDVVAKAIIFRTLEKVIPKEPWYDGGYRAQIVTYTIAKLVESVEGSEGSRSGRRVNLEQIWRKQALSAPLLDHLKKIAKCAFRVLTAPEAGIQNVTEWAKRELAWKRLQEVHVSLSQEFSDECLDADAVAGRNRAARSDAKVDAAVDALTEVLSYGAKNWSALRSKAVAAGAVSQGDESLLRIAVNPKWVPSDAQAKNLLKLRSRLADEGIS